LSKSLADFPPSQSLLPDGRIFGPNNPKQAPKNISWPGKISGRKMANFVQKWQKRGLKTVIAFYRGNSICYAMFLYQLSRQNPGQKFLMKNKWDPQKLPNLVRLSLKLMGLSDNEEIVNLSALLTEVHDSSKNPPLLLENY
jgi:hypothetical protein